MLFSLNKYMHIAPDSHQNSEWLFSIKFAKYIMNLLYDDIKYYAYNVIDNIL